MSNTGQAAPEKPSGLAAYIPSGTQVWASGRTLIAAATGGIATGAAILTTLHAATPDQAQMLLDNWNGMVRSGGDFIGYAGGFGVGLLAIYSGVKRSAKSLFAAVTAIKGVEGIAIDHNATGPAAEAAADSSLPTVKKGIVVPVAAPPPQPTLLGKEAI